MMTEFFAEIDRNFAISTEVVIPVYT